MKPRLRFGALALAAALSGILTAGPATAAEPNFPDTPTSTWDDPSTAPLDGIGAYLYLAPQPAPGPDQLPAQYDYLLLFSYENSSTPGAIGFGSGPNGPGGGTFVGFATGGSATVAMPYQWETGRLYFLLVHRLGDGLWGAWVYDVGAEAWTVVGQGQTPAEWGGLAPRSRTLVAWEDYESAAECSAYPRTDAYFTPPIGVRSGSFTLGTLVSDSVSPYGCATETSSFLGWAHYRLGH